MPCLICESLPKTYRCRHLISDLSGREPPERVANLLSFWISPINLTLQGLGWLPWKAPTVPNILLGGFLPELASSAVLCGSHLGLLPPSQRGCSLCGEEDGAGGPGGWVVWRRATAYQGSVCQGKNFFFTGQEQVCGQHVLLIRA